MTSGTIIVIAQTKRHVVIAADSRTGQTRTGLTVESIDDSSCKIVKLDEHTVFAAAGILGNGTEKWTGVSEAINARTRAIPGGQRIGRAQGDVILKAWAESMMRRMSDFSSQQLLTYASANENKLTTGVIAGAETDGAVWVHAVSVLYSSGSGLSYQPYTLTSKDPPTAYYFLGKGEIGMEFVESNVSKRAVTERDNWKRLKLSEVEFDRFKTRRLVELTIEDHRPESDVGGPVDEIELDADGARWIQVKENCRY